MVAHQETEEAEQAAAHENEDAENASVSALSGDGSEEEGSSRGGLDWMKQAARCALQGLKHIF